MYQVGLLFHQQAHRPLPSPMPLSVFPSHCSDVLGKGAQAPCASLLSHAMPLPVFFTLKICLHSFMLLRRWLSRGVRWDALLRSCYRYHKPPAPSHTPFNPPAFVRVSASSPLFSQGSHGLPSLRVQTRSERIRRHPTAKPSLR